jgi:cell division protein FtsI/penicillin-binding protein 2
MSKKGRRAMRSRPVAVSARPSLSRLIALASGLSVVLCALGGRLFAIQFRAHQELDRLAARQRGRCEPLHARPGDIVDSRGRLLATSITVASVYLDPSLVPAEAAELIHDLSQILQVDRQQLAARVAKHRQRRFLWVKRRVSDDELAAVRQAKWPNQCVGIRHEKRRCYPHGQLASHVVGLRDVDGVGRDGVEHQFDDALRGHDGHRIVARDARGKTLAIHEHLTQMPRDGSTVVLTIDSVLQMYTEQVLDQLMRDWKAASASAIVMDPHSGEILALANRPGFDPNSPQQASADAWVNRAISDSYEPGSTFKPFVAAAALNWKLVERDEIIDCHNGVYRMGPRVLHSHHPNGPLSFPELIIKSDNVGMAILGERLTNQGLFRAVELFGFGQATGVELPGEAPGLVLPFKNWTGYSTGSVPMGQEIAVTPMQLVTAFAALANGGHLLRPRIVRAVRSADGASNEPSEPVVVSRPVSYEVASFMTETVLRQVVDDPKGTGRRAVLSGYSVFGKTGTAQLANPRGGGYLAGHHISSFVAGAPAAAPEVVALVVVNDPRVGKTHYGGEIAAPATAEILKQALVYQRVQPDRPILAATRRPTRPAVRVAD